MPRYIFTSGDKKLTLLERGNDYQLILQCDDTTVAGQWKLNVKVRSELCSFDGKYFLCYYLNLSNQREYIALLQVPWPAPLTLWSGQRHWTGELKNGKLFFSPYTPTQHLEGKIPKDLTLQLYTVPRETSVLMLDSEGEFSSNTYDPLEYLPRVYP